MIQHPVQRLMTLQPRDLLSVNADAAGVRQHEANSANLSNHKKKLVQFLGGKIRYISSIYSVKDEVNNAVTYCNTTAAVNSYMFITFLKYSLHLCTAVLLELLKCTLIGLEK